jgi:hypothetical protein
MPKRKLIFENKNKNCPYKYDDWGEDGNHTTISKKNFSLERLDNPT